MKPTSHMKPHSLDEQANRRAELAAHNRSKLRPLLGDDARAENLLWWDQDRIPIWACNSFFLGDASDIAFGNVILRYALALPFEPGPAVFTAAGLAGVLACHSDRLEPEMRAAMQERLAAILPFGLTKDYQFHGYNDNMPVMWTWALAYGGEIFNEPRFTKIAWANLCQLKDLLRRRGTVAEYGQGYATHRLTGLAHIGQHSGDERLREIAGQCEARLWAEVAGHWSPAVSQIGGPAMRGCTPLIYETTTLLRNVLGDAITRIPWRDGLDDEARSAVRSLGCDETKYLFAYPYAYSAEFTSADYHVPDAVAELFYRKEPGFTFRCTSENGYSNGGIFCKQVPVYGQGGLLLAKTLTDEVVAIKDHPQHGAQPHELTSYHGANYVVGSSSTAQFATSHAFRCTYRRTEGMGAVCVRYNINDKIPGEQTIINKYWKSPDYPEEKGNYCGLYWDCGFTHAMQHKNTVLCLQEPANFEAWDIRSLRTDICFWQHDGKVDPVVDDDGLITINEGPVYIAIHPLIGRYAERKQAVKVSEMGGWKVVSLYNYEGPSREFSQRDLAKFGNGFVFEVRDASDYPSYEAFQNEMRQSRILDLLYGGRRKVHYARADLWLSTQYCPYAQTKMSTAVNGIEQVAPQFAFSDGSHVGLPFLDHKPAVGFEEWDWVQTQMTRKIETYNPRE